MTSQTFAGRALAAAALLALCRPPPSPAALDIAAPLPPALAQALQRAQQWRGARFLDWLPGGQMLLEAHTGHGILLERLDGPGVAAQSKSVPKVLNTITNSRFVSFNHCSFS